jgi:hypothetical protein
MALIRYNVDPKGNVLSIDIVRLDAGDQIRFKLTEPVGRKHLGLSVDTKGTLQVSARGALGSPQVHIEKKDGQVVVSLTGTPLSRSGGGIDEEVRSGGGIDEEVRSGGGIDEDVRSGGGLPEEGGANAANRRRRSGKRKPKKQPPKPE